MYVYVAGTPQANTYAMAQRYGLQMGAADLPGMPTDALHMQTYTSSRYREPESGFRQMFRQVADWFGQFSTVASLASIFFPAAAPAAAVAKLASPAVDMVVQGMNQTPPPMMAVTTAQRYLPTFR